VGPLPPGLHARVDESELQHALVNLVLNAVQACQPGGTVTLSAERDDLLRVRVTDDGCGIAPEERKRIFEPFVSLRKGGIGLGLFLSQSFVRRWGGEIAVESEPGRGSTFEIRLPPATAAFAGGTA
jgi:signal transduction histidine kinase